MRKFILCLILAAFVAGLALPVLAVHGGDVIIGQEVVLRIRYPAGGYTIQERADIITQRINNLLGSRPFEPSEVKVARDGSEYVVKIGDTLIITADRRTASFNKTTPEQLANIWADNLRSVIPKAKAEENPPRDTE